MFKLPSREELLSKVRKKTEELKAGRRDPDQFQPPKAQKGETHEFVFRVLPNLMAGEKHKNGICKTDSDIWYYENGTHYINNERYSCPRIHDHEECPLCKMGFELIAESDVEEYRRKVIKNYIATSYWAMNIYFPNIKKNPENLRGKVMWYNAPKGIHTKMETCIASDDKGDEDDPKACGIFYHPLEGYNFKLVVTCKGGSGNESFNNYDASTFIANSLSPLIKNEDGSPNEDEIQKILDQRVLLTDKFKPRDIAKLQAMVDKIHAASSGDDTEDIPAEPENNGKASSAPINPAPQADTIPEGLVKGGVNAAKKASAPAVPSATPTAKSKPPVDDDGDDPAVLSKTASDDEDDPQLADLLQSIQKKSK